MKSWKRKVFSLISNGLFLFIHNCRWWWTLKDICLSSTRKKKLNLPYFCNKKKQKLTLKVRKKSRFENKKNPQEKKALSFSCHALFQAPHFISISLFKLSHLNSHTEPSPIALRFAVCYVFFSFLFLLLCDFEGVFQFLFDFNSWKFSLNFFFSSFRFFKCDFLLCVLLDLNERMIFLYLPYLETCWREKRKSFFFFLLLRILNMASNLTVIVQKKSFGSKFNLWKSFYFNSIWKPINN